MLGSLNDSSTTTLLPTAEYLLSVKWNRYEYPEV